MTTKDMRQLLARVRRQGFVVEQDGGGHFRVTDPATGKVVHVPASPGYRTAKNAEARLRRVLGYQPKGGGRR